MLSPAPDNGNDDSMRQILSQYKPGSTRNLMGHDFRRVCLQLFGLEGHGKSSLINSCLCVAQNTHFSNEAGAGKSGKPFTMARKEYRLTDTVCIIDNRGLNNMTVDENLEVAAQLRNLRTLGMVDWNFELERTVNLLEDRYSNQAMDFIVPVFVWSIDNTFSGNLSNLISPFLRDAFEITGIFPIVVLTKLIDQDITAISKQMEELGAEHIIALDNYSTTNSARTPDTDKKVLSFLQICLQEADRGIQKKQNLDSQREFINQSVTQIKSEMMRQKELENKVLSQNDNVKMGELSTKNKELSDKEYELQSKIRQISNLKEEVNDLHCKLKMSYNQMR